MTQSAPKEAKIKFLFLTKLLFIFFIPVDMINGLLIREGYPSLSAPYKILVLTVISLYLLRQPQRLWVLFTIFILNLFLFIHAVQLNDTSLALAGLDMLVRFSAIFLFYIFFRKLINTGHTDYLFEIAKYSFWFLVANIIVGALGFGYGMYGGSGETAIGTKGVIYAGNEVAAALIISCALYMIDTLQQDKYLKFLWIGLLMLTICALMASKVSVLGGITIFFILPILKLVKNIKNFRMPEKDFYYSQFIFISVPLLTFPSIYYVLHEAKLIVRLRYFYEQMDLVTLILSNRNVWANQAMNAFLNYDISELYFGTGRRWWQYISEKKSVEMDPVDFLMNYGVVGFILVFGFVFYIFFTTIMNRKLNPYSIYIAFITFFIMALSTTAGHVLNSGTAGFLIAILFALGSYKKSTISA